MYYGKVNGMKSVVAPSSFLRSAEINNTGRGGGNIDHVKFHGGTAGSNLTASALLDLNRQHHQEESKKTKKKMRKLRRDVRYATTATADTSFAVDFPHRTVVERNKSVINKCASTESCLRAYTLPPPIVACSNGKSTPDLVLSSSKRRSRSTFSRLAATLHLPHYFGQGDITSSNCADTSDDIQPLRAASSTHKDPVVAALPFLGMKKKRSAAAVTSVVAARQHTGGHPGLYRTFSSSPVVNSRLDETSSNRDHQKLENIEARFILDRLNLVQENNLLSASVRRALATTSGSTMNNVKHFVGRRKSLGASVSVPTWFRNVNATDTTTAADKSTTAPSSANASDEQQSSTINQQHYSKMRSVGGGGASSSDFNIHQQSADPMHALRQQYAGKMDTFVRVYMKEGRVVLYTGVQAQERYLFLFSDLLLVAKENYRGINSYRLKEKIRLCEVWISDKGLEDVAETVRSPQHSFVFGWPMRSYVAEFKSVEERNAWYETLSSIVTSVKRKERPNTTTVNVRFKVGKAVKNCRVAVNNFQTARELRDTALASFDVSPASVDEYQLWVQSGRETAAYPLHGHEYPFAILLSHIRDLLPDSDGDVDVALLNDLTVGARGIKCNFLLKAKRGAKKGKGSKHTAGQLVSHFKRKMKKQDSTDSACPPSPTGKLFGVPLDVLTETQPVPKPILALMEHLAAEGSYMEGIFRKPPKNSTLKELKEKLDAGYSVSLDGVSPSVTASLLKEFFRQLPDALLGNEKINSWVSLCDETNPEEKLHKARSLVSQLPSSNSRLLRYFICLLHMIAVRSAYNQMNSFNLGVCVAPSLTGSSRQGHLSGAVAKRMSELAQYLIDNAVALFGPETLTLLKAPDDHPKPPPSTVRSAVVVCNSSDDYDPVQFKQETSSMDSLTATGSSPSSSRPHSSLHQAVNISRDSGLCEPHGHSEDMRRRLSHSEDTEDDALCPMASSLTTQSIDDLALMSAQKRRTRVISEPHISGPRSDDYGLDKNSVSSKPIGLHRQQVNVDSTDSIYEPASNSPAFLPCPEPLTPVLRSSKRMSSASLIRSASGDHLYLTERIQADEEPNLLTPTGPQDVRHSGRRRSPRRDVEHSPLTVSLTAGDSSYGSSPVSPECNDMDGNRNGGISQPLDGPRSLDASRSLDGSRSLDVSQSLDGSKLLDGFSPTGDAKFMTRNSAYRKPARRKSQAPQAPSPVNDHETRQESPGRLDRTLHSSDTSNDDDSGVHVMEVHTARPVIVSCNCESSSSLSSDDEKSGPHSDRENTSGLRPVMETTPVHGRPLMENSLGQRPSVENQLWKDPVMDVASPVVPITFHAASPPATVISAIYPLKSPMQGVPDTPTATRFIVDSSPSTQKLDSPVVRRNSSRVASHGPHTENHVSRHSLDESSTLTERVFRGLEMMMERVENAHVGQDKLLRPPHGPDTVNDSSTTVTEASSEDSTPHVSREGSSAQEYKQVARGMFDQPGFGPGLGHPIYGRGAAQSVSGRAFDQPNSGRGSGQPISGHSFDQSISGHLSGQPTSGHGSGQPTSGYGSGQPTSGHGLDYPMPGSGSGQPTPGLLFSQQIPRRVFDHRPSGLGYDQAVSGPGLLPRSSETLPRQNTTRNATSTMPATTQSSFPTSVRPERTSVHYPRESNHRITTSEQLKSYSRITSYHSFSGTTSTTTVPWYRAKVVRTSERPVSSLSSTSLLPSIEPVETVRSGIQYPAEIGKTGNSSTVPVGNSSTVPPSTPVPPSMPVERIIPVIPGQVRDRVQRYDRERLRRKTLGGLELNALAQMVQEEEQQPQSPPPSENAPVQVSVKSPLRERVSRYEQHRSSAMISAAMRSLINRNSNAQPCRSKSLDRRLVDDEDEEPALVDKDRRKDISWSVRRYVEMFDNAGKRVHTNIAH